MKIQIFDSTALACSLLREAVEQVLNRHVRFSEHEINSVTASENNAKMVHVNGAVTVRGNVQYILKIDATVVVWQLAGKFTGQVEGTFFLTAQDQESSLHRFKWESKRDEIVI